MPSFDPSTSAGMPSVVATSRTSSPRSGPCPASRRQQHRRGRSMAKLTYGMMVSLDGFVADPKGDFNWVRIDKEIHRFANEETRNNGTEIYGRRMYETMVYWETHEAQKDRPEYEDEFARIWKGLDK